MGDDLNSEIDAAIAYIQRHLYEPLPLAKLARHIGYSPFHFTRMFKKRIGLPPLYYASALRLQKAKDLLLETSLSIRDVGLEIGQQSLGTFTTRFTDRVGMSPSHFRHSSEAAGAHLRLLRELNDWSERRPSLMPHGAIRGTVFTEIPFEGVILIGLFPKPIPEGLPLYGTLISSSREFWLSDIKPGTYYLMATSVSWGASAREFLLPHATLRTRSREPIVVKPYSSVLELPVTLHPPLPDDPPILISLPLLMNRFLNRVSGGRRTTEIPSFAGDGMR
ncbi:helix-turn-helix domain-containing protein [Cohnella boryungensis]|uniref:Helix-turn-helix domain-containing protein n=1 Tax=Cohnella boryungensis TaxID=768479 RepID=A0ABV8SAQ1_9BACL